MNLILGTVNPVTYGSRFRQALQSLNRKSPLGEGAFRAAAGIGAAKGSDPFRCCWDLGKWRVVLGGGDVVVSAACGPLDDGGQVCGDGCWVFGGCVAECQVRVGCCDAESV